MVVHRLEKDEARRIAVHAQLLDSPRPTDLVDIVDRLTVLQIDPTAAIAPSADLVLWSRLGATYDPAHLTKAIEHDRTLVETVAYIRSPRDLPAVIAEVRDAKMRAFAAGWIATNEPFRRDILALLEKEGPLLSRDIPDTSVEPWPSSGWTNNRNVTKMLESLALRGHVAISGRKGRQRYWDLPERVYPADLPTLDLDGAVRHRNERRLAALGIARSTGPQIPGEPPYVGEAGEEAVVEGMPGTWRVHPAYVGRAVPGAHGAALALRPAHSRPGPRRAALRLRVHPRDVQAEGASAAGATSPSRSCTATGSSASSTRPPIARPARSSSTPSTRTSASPRP